MNDIKVFLDTSYILKNKTGIGMYTSKLMVILNKMGLNVDYPGININIPYRYFIHTLWLNTVIYLKTLFLKPKYFISPAFTMPFFTSKRTKYITVIHDLCGQRNNEISKYHNFISNLSMKITLKKADVIVTVSETVKEELIKNYQIDSSRIKVIYNSVGNHFNKDCNTEDNLLVKYFIEPQKYILSVATLNKRKNIPELIKAFESISNKYPDIKLLLVGGMGNEDRDKLTKHPKVVFTGYIQDEEIPVLYKHALMYVFPSFYEGFGIPIIEAQYSGTPLICSDIPIFREVAGDGVEFCTTDSEGILKKMEYLINNEARRKELSVLGLENVKRFSIEKISEQLNEVLNS